MNLSIEDILNRDTVEFLKEKLKNCKFANLITFEILEDENISNYDNVIDFINNMKRYDCNIAIDDFGSGYSNFIYLLKLKPDFLKIDGSLIKDIHNDTNAFFIVKAINDFAHSLGMQTVAEFVHSKEVFDIVRELNIDVFQGYHFHQPLKDVK
jgi:EAL domain-containing protein (putative c-di-GMP-specific phosphodiesterase class I)